MCVHKKNVCKKKGLKKILNAIVMREFCCQLYVIQGIMGKVLKSIRLLNWPLTV